MVDKVMSLPEGSRIMVLAPIVRERKGEHLHVFNELRTSGFIRARVDGLVCEIDYPPELEKNKKHSIDVVVDRLKIKDGLQQRLAESFETAIQLADGLAMVSHMEDEKAEDMVFSALFACPKCGHSISELEPRLFSFNNPAGACTSCDGLGLKQFFDEKRILVDESLALSEGAIRGMGQAQCLLFPDAHLPV
jgi:excinuclease ABC subunit A